MTAIGLTISRLGARVRLAGDPRSLAWTQARGASYFGFDNLGIADCWTIVAGREHLPGFSGLPRRTDAVAGKSCAYWVDPEARTVVIDVAQGPWRDLWALRFVRHFLRWQLFHAGAIFIHASAFVKDSVGTALMGKSGAGKTTTLLNLLRSDDALFVAEDDLTIVESPSGELIALGWPGCVRLRREMLRSFPEFARPAQFEHPENEETLDSGSGGLLRLFPEELTTILGCGHVAEAPLRSIVLLEWSERSSCRQMTSLGVRESLYESWDILPERLPGTKPRLVDGVLPRSREFCFFPLFHDIFGLPGFGPSLQSLERYAEMVKGYRVQHCGDADLDRELFQRP